MELFFHPMFLKHDAPGHPENAKRLSLLKLDTYTEAKSGEKYLERVHSRDYVDMVRQASAAPALAHLDPDTYVNQYTYEAACLAAGAAVQAAEKGGFALTRPPGHHAPFGGFCIFNNVVIAARATGKRVFIIDWDAHHGNGTQALVRGDEKMMYFSTHQSPMYPGSGLESEGNAINVPLQPGAGDTEFLAAVDAMLKPALAEFQPELVAVSAGFDSYYKDAGMLTNMRLTAKSYEAVCELIRPYKRFFVLEGGYNPESVRDGVEAVLNFFK